MNKESITKEVIDNIGSELSELQAEKMFSLIMEEYSESDMSLISELDEMGINWLVCQVPIILNAIKLNLEINKSNLLTSYYKFVSIFLNNELEARITQEFIESKFY